MVSSQSYAGMVNLAGCTCALHLRSRHSALPSGVVATRVGIVEHVRQVAPGVDGLDGRDALDQATGTTTPTPRGRAPPQPQVLIAFVKSCRYLMLLSDAFFRSVRSASPRGRRRR